MTEIILKVNEKKIRLNDIMKEMLINIIIGYLKTLKEIPDEFNKINIDIKF